MGAQRVANVSRPLIYGSIVVIAAVAFWTTNPESAKAAKNPTSKTSTRKSLDQDWSFPEGELEARFEKPNGPARNIFKPLLEPEKSSISTDEQEIVKLPANFADGEPDWAYTGMVEVDGKRLALLENASKHQGGYVREGEIWKKSKILKITMAGILLEGPDGSQATVNRFNANAVPKEKPPAEGGFKPLDVGAAIRGPIGLQLNPTGSPSSDSVPMKRPSPSQFEEIKQ
jgi:hypothetical protein